MWSASGECRIGTARFSTAQCTPIRVARGDERPPTQVEMIRAPATPDSVPMVRRTIVDDLTERGVLEETIDEAEIVVSELSRTYSGTDHPLGDGTIRVRWKVRFEVVEIEVTDGGSDTVPTPAPGRCGRPAVAACASCVPGARVGVSMTSWGAPWAALGGPSRRRAT